MSGPMCLWHLTGGARWRPFTAQKSANIRDRCKWRRSFYISMVLGPKRKMMEFGPILHKAVFFQQWASSLKSIVESRHIDVPSCSLICLGCFVCSFFSIDFSLVGLLPFRSSFWSVMPGVMLNDALKFNFDIDTNNKALQTTKIYWQIIGDPSEHLSSFFDSIMFPQSVITSFEKCVLLFSQIEYIQ